MGRRMRSVLYLIAFLFLWTIWASPGSSESKHNGTICTLDVCRLNESTLRFFHLGDWGGQDEPPYVTPTQVIVAKTMNRMGVEKRVHFVLSIGDNFYTSGPTSVNDSRFRTTFDDVYTFGKDEHVPWYMTAGNHDYYGDVNAQLEYSKLNPRWIYPNLSYVARYELLPSTTTVDMILIDTVVLCGETWGGGYNAKIGKTQQAFELPTEPADHAKAEELWLWLQRQLERSSADYLLVVSHYPIFTAGRHGDFTCPGTRLLSLLEQYNATAYLFGHDHNLQHLQSVSTHGRIVHHILSGGGNSLDKGTRQLHWPGINVSGLFFYPHPDQHRYPNTDNVGGFVYAEINEHNGSFRFFAGDGKELYEAIVHPRPKSKGPSLAVDRSTISLPFYSNFAISADSISRTMIFTAALFLIWLIGMYLVRRSITRNRTKESRPQGRIIRI